MSEKDIKKSFHVYDFKKPASEETNHRGVAGPDSGKDDVPRLKVMTQVELDRRVLPERDWIIHPLLQRRATAMIYGPRGTGKSYFAMGIALAAATGTDFMGWDVNEPHRVVYVDGEMPVETLQERFHEGVAGCDGDYRSQVFPDWCEDKGLLPSPTMRV